MARISTWQRSVLLYMYYEGASTKRAGGYGEEFVVFFTRRAIAEALWFSFQTYHKKAMDALVKQGWVAEEKSVRGNVAYCLTSSGVSSINSDMTFAGKFVELR